MSNNMLYKFNLFLAEIFRPLPKPKWNSNYEVVSETNSYRLLDFSRDYSKTPTLILPPQAGGHSNIADYDPPNASLIQTCINNDRGNVFCVEYKPASSNNNQSCICDLIRDTKSIVNQLGGRVRIIGLCQGVWQSVIYTSLYPDTVEDMILTAGPVDFAADPENKIYKAAMNTNDVWYKIMLSLNAGRWPGDMQSFGFKMLDPFTKIYKFYETLFYNVDNEEWLQRHRTFVNWFDARQDLGSWAVDSAKRLFRENQLVKGQLMIDGDKALLENINCPITVMWADKDDITSPEQLLNIKNHVNVSVNEIRLKNCGHIGAFISKNALDNYWANVL